MLYIWQELGFTAETMECVIYNLSQLRRHNLEKLAFFDTTYGRNSLRKKSHKSLGYLVTIDPRVQVRSLNLTWITVSLTRVILQICQMRSQHQYMT